VGGPEARGTSGPYRAGGVKVIAVSCTCGLWQVDGDTAPDQCPKCGAAERYDRKGPDYIAEPWEELDVRGRMWGVFAAEGYSPEPIAIFSTEDQAHAWLTWQDSLGDDSTTAGADYTVGAIDALEGHCWNSHEDPPQAERDERDDLRSKIDELTSKVGLQGQEISALEIELARARVLARDAVAWDLDRLECSRAALRKQRDQLGTKLGRLRGQHRDALAVIEQQWRDLRELLDTITADVDAAKTQPSAAATEAP
jgi:hypothetical protein